jgi:hypothetical protein
MLLELLYGGGLCMETLPECCVSFQPKLDFLKKRDLNEKRVPSRTLARASDTIVSSRIKSGGATLASCAAAYREQHVMGHSR